MCHLQLNLKRGDGIFAVDLDPVRVIAGHGIGAGIRPPGAVGERKIRYGQAGMLVAHGGAENQLAQNQQRGSQHERPQTGRHPKDGLVRNQSSPKPAGEQRQRAGQNEKQLRNRSMKNAERVHVERHAQPAQHALRDDQKKGDHAEPAHPRARIFEPEPHGQNGGHQADRRGK